MDYRVEWMPAVALVGIVTLLFVPVLGLLVGLAIVALLAIAVLALVGSVIAVPFLIARSLYRHRRAPAAARRSERRVYGAETALPPARVG